MNPPLRLLSALVILSPVFALEYFMLRFSFDGYPGIMLTTIGITLLMLPIMFKVITKVMVIGPVEYLMQLGGTPSPDDLERAKQIHLKSLSDEDIITLDEIKCKRGGVRIFGDWLLSIDESDYTITRLAYTGNILEFELSNRFNVYIENPGIMDNSDTFLKIFTATRVEVTDKLNGQFKRTYIREKKGMQVNDTSRFRWQMNVNPYFGAFLVLGSFE